MNTVFERVPIPLPCCGQAACDGMHFQDFSLETVFLQVDAGAKAGDASTYDQGLFVFHFTLHDVVTSSNAMTSQEQGVCLRCGPEVASVIPNTLSSPSRPASPQNGAEVRY